MDFLMGGKKKTATSKVGAVSTPNVQVGVQPVQMQTAAVQPDGVNNLTPGVEPAAQAAVGGEGIQPAAGVQFVNSNSVGKNPQAEVGGVQPAAKGAGGGVAQPVSNGASNPSGKKSISEVIHKLHDELSELKDRSIKLVTDVNEIDNKVSEMGHRVESLEDDKIVNDEKIAVMEENMTKFLSLYELINNQYNPFIDKDSIGKMSGNHSVALTSQVSNAHAEHLENNGLHNNSHGNSELPFSKPIDSNKKMDLPSSKYGDLDSSLLELDTLNIEQAAGDAVPLTQLKNNTNSLVVILSWLEYMIKKVGIEETRNSLRYYTEVLRWITPEVFFDLDKYLRGMKDKKDVDNTDSLDVKDHIVSLYFISKLNEKKLDEKLTAAVLQIIKE
jgi:archaellum component FlaD/FlaE